MEETSSVLDVLGSFIEFLTGLIQIISDTASNIDHITFEKSLFKDYMGYAHYAMGTPLYTLFTTIILIAIGVTLWTYILKGIGMIRNLLPF
jgi:hypothetical protein